jgi:hypothetical protein|tara:strand:- start:161 stop:703 length:543 start_codon:yes stop_codon:yes gene_type:complete
MNDTNLIDILEIKPPMGLDPENGSIWAIWILIFLFLAGAALLFWALRTPSKPNIDTPPDVEAQHKLRQTWALLGTPALFAEAVADILRVYLGERFNFHAPERTTEEFLQELQLMPQMTKAQKALLGQFLLFCDLSKFARHNPSEDECRNLHTIAVNLVDETAPSLPGKAPPRIDPPQLKS